MHSIIVTLVNVKSHTHTHTHKIQNFVCQFCILILIHRSNNIRYMIDIFDVRSNN